MSKVPCNLNKMSKHVGIAFTWFWTKQKEHIWNITPVCVSKHLATEYKSEESVIGKWLKVFFWLSFLNFENIEECFAFDLFSCTPDDPRTSDIFVIGCARYAKSFTYSFRIITPLRYCLLIFLICSRFPFSAVDSNKGREAALI
jgi:hypothetical protein